MTPLWRRGGQGPDRIRLQGADAGAGAVVARAAPGTVRAERLDLTPGNRRKGIRQRPVQAARIAQTPGTGKTALPSRTR